MTVLVRLAPSKPTVAVQSFSDRRAKCLKVNSVYPAIAHGRGLPERRDRAGERHELDVSFWDGAAVAALECAEGEDPVGRVVDAGQTLVRHLALARHLELLPIDLGEDERLGLGTRLLAPGQHEGGQDGHHPDFPHLGVLLDLLRRDPASGRGAYHSDSARRQPDSPAISPGLTSRCRSRRPTLASSARRASGSSVPSRIVRAPCGTPRRTRDGSGRAPRASPRRTARWSRTGRR